MQMRNTLIIEIKCLNLIGIISRYAFLAHPSLTQPCPGHQLGIDVNWL